MSEALLGKCKCGHPTHHHDAGECWTNEDGSESQQNTCGCFWYQPVDDNTEDRSDLELYNADENCEHDIHLKWSGYACTKCTGWSCA